MVPDWLEPPTLGVCLGEKEYERIAGQPRRDRFHSNSGGRRCGNGISLVRRLRCEEPTHNLGHDGLVATVHALEPLGG